jgi:hypothetical protein
MLYHPIALVVTPHTTEHCSSAACAALLVALTFVPQEAGFDFYRYMAQA